MLGAPIPPPPAGGAMPPAGMPPAGMPPAIPAPPAGGAPSFGFGRQAPGGGVGGADAMAANRLFEQVQRLMGEFEAGLPRFERATRAASQVMGQLSAAEQQLLSGQVSQALHQRFMQLQQTAERFGTHVQTSDPNFGPFVQTIEVFVQDLAKHNADVLAAVTKVEGLVP